MVAGTDGIDGWLARRQGTTRSGAFLDPLADKVVVLGALVALAVSSTVSVAAGGPASRPGRSGMSRSTARGPAAAACRSRPGTSAKVKTLVQDLAIGPACCRRWPPQHGLQLVAIWVAAALTRVHRRCSTCSTAAGPAARRPPADESAAGR